MKFTNPFTAIKEKIARSEYNRIKMEIDESIQIREFDGEIYVSYRGVPLIKETELNKDVCEIVTDIRKTLSRFRGVDNTSF